MFKDYPVQGVKIRKVKAVRQVSTPFYDGGTFRAGQQEYLIHAEGIGDFYAARGNYVEYSPSAGADPDWVNIYLSGHVLAALLHQRKIINFHASSFIYKEKGIMILGETGAGKSSLTTAFTLNNGGFLSDDFTPVIVKEGSSFIWPVYRTIKIRVRTINQLKIEKSRITKAEHGTDKYFLDVAKADVEEYPLHYILKIEIGKNNSTSFYIPDSVEKFTLLRSEICSWEIIKGMPLTEKKYFHQLLRIIESVEVIKVIRPSEIHILDLQSDICRYLSDKYNI